ncbi:hypothetical protein HME9304_01839 [Flagellimonas maritima]|uniref:RepB family plasmid replication initiator protein n=1 Tax=Flagellimonas maritima TaxID=1383885 RepID=A0A2Z4LTC1_9FLAO|nr:hypothetical protein [Allomuricauda aurantiaca]AWX44834.1 hypothetical protein HME9304_01839 [Allomuricauda aurantiaca]
MNKSNRVLQPMRFVDAYCDFTPLQKDFIMLVQHKTSKQKEIVSDFTIDLKPYFLAKGLKLDSIRQIHYKEVTDDLMKSKVTFKYLKGDSLYSVYNLFRKCKVNQNLSLEISIIDDVLPLFYINKLEEGHFQGNRLVKELFQQSYPEYDKYISYYPKTYVNFRESQTKKLFEKLLQFRRLKNYTYEFAKDEIYLLLGYGYLRDKSEESLQQQIFQIMDQEFVQTSYKGINGWKNLRSKLNKWLKEISENKETGIKVLKSGNNYFTTKGRPIRSIFIQVEFDQDLMVLTAEQQKSIEFLKRYELSSKQKFKIVCDFDYKTIVSRINNMIIAMNDKGNRYFGDKRTPNYNRIQNVPGFVYGIIFNYGKKTNASSYKR